jgi:hypothetical protein
MTVGVRVEAALASRLQQGRTASQATFPNQKGPPGQHPTARWVCQYLGGIHLRRLPGAGACVLTVHDQPRPLRRLLGHPSEACSS